MSCSPGVLSTSFQSLSSSESPQMDLGHTSCRSSAQGSEGSWDYPGCIFSKREAGRDGIGDVTSVPRQESVSCERGWWIANHDL